MALLALYGLRVMWLQGWHIVTYALGIYLLNLFIAFISPKFDPAMEEQNEDGERKIAFVFCCPLPFTVSLSPPLSPSHA